MFANMPSLKKMLNLSNNTVRQGSNKICSLNAIKRESIFCTIMINIYNNTYGSPANTSFWFTQEVGLTLPSLDKKNFYLPILPFFSHFVLLCPPYSQSSLTSSVGCLGNSKAPPEGTLWEGKCWCVNLQVCGKYKKTNTPFLLECTALCHYVHITLTIYTWTVFVVLFYMTWYRIISLLVRDCR